MSSQQNQFKMRETLGYELLQDYIKTTTCNACGVIIPRLVGLFSAEIA